MKGRKVPVGEFMAKYGDRVTAYSNDLSFPKSPLEVTVFEGTDVNSVRDYLSQTGFSDISDMDNFFGGARNAALTMSRDTTDYASILFGNNLKGKAASIIFNSLGIERTYKKIIGNKLPIADREHARVCDLGNGEVAVLMHKDPGIGHYANKGALGIMEAALYHFGLVDMSQYGNRMAA